MAQSLVTQVHNPDDSAGVELGTQGVYIEERKQQKEPSFWSKLCHCVCLPCCSKPPQGQTDAKANGTELPSPDRAPAPQGKALLAPLIPQDQGKKCLVLDLDETLVHSSFKPVPNADFVISIELEGELHHVYVLKRPGVDEFLQKVGEKFEVVVFTASLAKYADPLLDQLDIHQVIRARLFREACVQHYGNYVKDLSMLGRELRNTLIIDNSPYSYIFQPDNAVPITSWFNDQNDRQLYEILPLLDELDKVEDVSAFLQGKNMNFAHVQGQNLY